MSIKNHGWYSADNTTGYKIAYFYAPKEQLNDLEQEYIKKYANAGYQLRNKTAGSQSSGKFGIADNRPAKGYYDGKKQGKIDLINQLNNIINKYLNITVKKDNKLSQRMLDKFYKLLDVEGLQNDKDRETDDREPKD